MPPRKARPTKDTNKPKSGALKNVSASKETALAIPLELQQLLLNIFKDSFSERLESDIQPLLQEVKGHLYNRDFSTAFGRNDYLEAYAARWSPSRALGYLQVLADLKEYITAMPEEPAKGLEKRRKIVCLGGGAGAEIVAFGGLIDYVRRTSTGDEKLSNFDIVAIDIADWSSVIEELSKHIVNAPPLSKYASAVVKATNGPLVRPDSFDVTFQRKDILTADISLLEPSFQHATLVTIMFTLNELYSTSLPLTQKFLLNLTGCLKEGALLLVVDSPGSYSTISFNGTEKRYPMQWLLDHTLLSEGTKGEEASWTKIEEEESKWFRLESTLNYPIELENMRFQLHLYRRGA